MLDGLSRIPDLIELAQKHGQKALAVTDHGGMYGAMHFYNACRRAEIKPIIGVEAYMAKESRLNKQTRPGGDQFHITLLATSHLGYRNLMHLISHANLDGFSYRPRIDFELLTKHNQDVIATSGCMNSIFNSLLLEGKRPEAIEWFKKFKELFGDRFYIELQKHQVEQLDDLNRQLIEVARELDIQIIATNDVHYVHANEAPAQDALLCVQTRKLISDTKRMTMMESPDYYLRSTQEMVELFHDYPEAITNTVSLAEKCEIDIPTGKLNFPEFAIPDGKTHEQVMEEMAMAGLKRRFTTITDEHRKRLKYELDIISQKGYSTYFLITQDFVNWAKQQGIGVGPGRGSAAGSLVSFSLGITDIDPLFHGLPFERFLNPQRPTPPDIDIDFADDRRDEVIQYAADRYGHDHVAQVITFGRMEARVAIRDIGRVLGMPYEDPDKIAKLIPNNPGKKTSLAEAIRIVPELAQYYQQPKFKKLIDLAQQVEGVVRHSSVHAAAVVIADKPLMEYTPIQQDSKTGKTVTQYDMYVLDCNISDDAIGLLKFDFLGLRNLSIIQTAVQLIKENKGEDLVLAAIPLDDKKTFDMISAGETTGMFQLESAGMRRVARSLRPNQFSDITAMVALYRPGPMDLIPQFIEGKHNQQSIVYPHETLKPILEETYGVMVYQEQILQIANTMAGYSLGEADILRRAIGKKKKKLLDENKKRFIEQSVSNKYTKEVAQKVWGFIEAFANYGFNKAHAASYAMIAYQTAYLKANYSVEYMAALMSVESNSHSMNRDSKVAQAIGASKQMGIKILPPEINHSGRDFSIETYKESNLGQAIRFGLSAIKHVGEAAIENILETRNRVGEFGSLTQFIQETDGRKVNKKVLECLIKVGAMDRFGSRAAMLENLEEIRDRATQFQANIDGQDNLFSTITEQVKTTQDTFPDLPEYPNQELLSFEKELLGLYLTEHPMAQALQAVSQMAEKKIGDVDLSIHKEQIFLFGGYLSSFRQVRTKTSMKDMAFGMLEDETGTAEFVVFPKTYQQYGHLLQPEGVVLMKARVDDQEGELKLMVEKITVPNEVSIAHAEEQNAHEVFIPRRTDKDVLSKLGKLLKEHKGSDKVVIIIPNGETPKRMLLPYGVHWTQDLADQIQTLLAIS